MQKNNTHVEIRGKGMLALRKIQICLKKKENNAICQTKPVRQPNASSLARGLENTRPSDKKRSRDQDENFTRSVTPSHVYGAPNIFLLFRVVICI